MKKHKKIFNLLIVLLAIFSIIIFTKVESFAFNAQVPAVQAATETKQIEQNAVKQTTIPQQNAYDITHMKKTGFKYGLLKFLTAMLGVLVSALAIFLGLKFYQRLMLKNNVKLDNIDYDKTLESPRDFKEAINLFLDKTNK